MKKVAENTFRAYARQAVKKLNTTELTASLKSINAKMVEISLYLGEREVGYVSVGSDGFIFVQDYVRDDLFSIAPENNSLKKVFENVYTEVNGSLDNGWFTVEKEEVAEETVEEPKAEDSKVKAAAQYLESKITGWYENARVDYCVKGKFISCKAEGENGIRINWEEDGKEYTMVINWFTEYSAEQLYNIWMAQDVEVEEVKKQPKEEEQHVTVVENPKLFAKTLVQKLKEAGFATTSCKEESADTYNLHAMADRGVMVDIDFEAGVNGKLSSSVVVSDLADCSVVDGEKYSTEADYIKAIVEKVISSSNREQKIVEANKIFESTDTTDDKVRKLQKEFRQWEVLQEREKEADEAYEANYKDKELEKTADEAYAAEYKQYDKIARMIAELINIDVLTAKGMLMKTPKHVKKILGL